MKEKYSQKKISLDIKRPFKIVVQNSYNSIAQSIKFLTFSYGLQGKVMIESSSNYLLKLFSSETVGIETYYFCLGDFDKGVAIELSPRQSLEEFF